VSILYGREGAGGGGTVGVRGEAKLQVRLAQALRHVRLEVRLHPVLAGQREKTLLSEKRPIALQVSGAAPAAAPRRPAVQRPTASRAARIDTPWRGEGSCD